MLFAHRHVRIERVVLKHHRDVAIARAHVVHDLAADLDRPVVGVLEAGDRAQQRALAAAGRADQHGELPVGNDEIDAAHGMHAAGVALVQSADPYFRHRGYPRTSSSSAAHRAERQPAHEMLLHQHAEHDRRHERNDRERARFAVLRALETRNARNTVGSVKALRLVRTSAKKNSVQQAMKAKTAAATMPGAASGTATFQNELQRVQPSTSAASSSERGIWRK